LKHTFLYKVYQHSPRLFYVLCCFAALTVFFNAIGDEVTPFFVWGMYSEKEKPVQRYELLRTTINDSIPLQQTGYLLDATRFYLSGPLGSFKKLQDNGGVDPVKSFLQSKLKGHYSQLPVQEHTLFNTGLSAATFFDWYSRYLHAVTAIDVQSIKVEVVQVHYNKGKIVTDSTYLFEQWKRP
jgi:hypothetical protein